MNHTISLPPLLSALIIDQDGGRVDALPHGRFAREMGGQI